MTVHMTTKGPSPSTWHSGIAAIAAVQAHARPERMTSVPTTRRRVAAVAPAAPLATSSRDLMRRRLAPPPRFGPGGLRRVARLLHVAEEAAEVRLSRRRGHPTVDHQRRAGDVRGVLGKPRQRHRLDGRRPPPAPGPRRP